MARIHGRKVGMRRGVFFYSRYSVFLVMEIICQVGVRTEYDGCITVVR